MKRTIFFCQALLLVLVLAPAGLQAQREPYSEGFLLEYFFGNHPNPRTEALGLADVAVGGAVSSLFYNPAGLGLIQSWEADLSTSAPYYLERDATYYFGGYAHRLHEKVVVAASFHRIASGEIPGFGLRLDGQQFPVDEPVATNLTLSAAASPLPGLQLGLNANFLSWEVFDEGETMRSPHLDLGALYTLPLSDASRLQFGASVTNVLFTSLNLISPDGSLEEKSPMPMVGRLGATYLHDFTLDVPGAGEQPLGLLLTVEGQEVFNNPYRTAIRVGSEVVVARFLAFRLGAFTYDWIGEPGGSGRDPRPNISDVTYGLGVILPLQDWTKGKLPANLHFDVCSLRQPPFAFGTERFPNKRSLGLRLVSNLK